MPSPLQTTANQFLQAIADVGIRNAIGKIVFPLTRRTSARVLRIGTLAIIGAGNAGVKTTTQIVAAVGPSAGNQWPTRLVVKAAGNMPALVGSVANATFNVFAFFMNQAGTITVAQGLTPGSTLLAVTFPPIPDGSVLIGFVIINPTGTGAFVGGTTPLDDATVVPNANYVDIIGGFDPYVVP